MTLAAYNAIKFLVARAKSSERDPHALCRVAVTSAPGRSRYFVDVTAWI
jgi:hypothetical protein